MPTTVNGVGTHYYGKRNIQSRPGTCPHCRRSVTLVSYDTRLWFVVVFIPVFPLGRKRILDSCPACRRHYVTDLDKWETTRQLETSGAMEKFRSNPSPETAIEAHRQLVSFHQMDEAAKFQDTMCEQFPDNAKIQVHVGTVLRQLGKVRESEPFFERALQLRPDLPEARVGVAQAHIRAKRLDEASALLDFMDKPGAGQLYPLGPLEQLAIAYQETGQHLKALPLFRRLLEELPTLADNPKFRKLVQKSETGQEPSILPKTKFSWRRFFRGGGGNASVSNRKALVIAGCTIVLICAGLAISNAYVRSHRTLYVINGAEGDVHLDISGVGVVNAPRGLTRVTIPEGHYDVKMSGAVDDEAHFNIGSTYFSRWADKPGWILNPGGRAILIVTRAVYSKNPIPGTFTYHFGKNFEALSRVDYPFTPLPSSISVDSSADQKVLFGLELFHGKPINAFYGLEEVKRSKEAFELAEWSLRTSPADKTMLRAYMNGAVTLKDVPRIRDFLHAGVTNGNVPIEWHRAYQDTCLESDNSHALLTEYQNLLAANPTNSDLLYLCGRACEDAAQGRDFFNQAVKANAANPYPIYALAYDSISRGAWQEGKPMLDKVVKLAPDDPDFRDAWKAACVALGQYDEVEKEFHRVLQSNPLDWQATESLCSVLASEGKRAEADAAISNVVRAFRAKSPTSADEVRSMVETYNLYAIGDFSGMEQLVKRDSSPSGHYAMFETLIEQNRLDEAAKTLPLAELKNPEYLLAGSIAFRLANRPVDADAWKAACVNSLREQGGSRNGHLVSVLANKSGSPLSELDDIPLPPMFKAMVLADMAFSRPNMRDQLNKSAQQLAVERIFPYHLVQRATKATAAH